MNMATWLVSSVLAPQDTMHIVCSFTFFTSSCRFQRKCRKGRLSLNQKIGMELSTETPSKRRLSEFITVRPDVCCHIIPFLVSHCDCWNTLTVKTGEVIIGRRKNKNLQKFSFTVAAVSIKLHIYESSQGYRGVQLDALEWYKNETRKQTLDN
jgi:hypothetical protein